MAKRMRWTVALLTGFATCRFVAADTLVLDDGRQLTGDVTRADGGGYVVKTKAGSITFSAGQVLKWEKSAATPSAAPSPPMASTGKPVPKADPAEIAARASKLIEQGAAALQSGDAQAALENFLDARSVFERQKIYLNPSTNPDHFAILEGIGTAYLALGRYEKANEPLERAYTSKLHGRSITINRAILDYVQRVNVMHGVKELKDFIAARSSADEVELNVLGASLDLAGRDEHFYQTQFFKQAQEFYDAKNKELEATKPGEGRWGAEWMSSEFVKPKKSDFDKGVAKYNKAIENMRSAEAGVRSAQAYCDKARSPNSGITMSSALGKLTRAKENLAGAAAAQQEAWKAIPRPVWPKAFAPALPEFVGSGVFGEPSPSKPVEVAMAKPLEAAIKNSSGSTPPVKPAKASRETVAVAPSADAGSSVKPAAKAAPGRRMVTRSAVAVPVGPDLLITAAAPVEGAAEFLLETPSGDNFKAELVRKDAATGLALLRVAGKQFRYLNLATGFAGGDVTCWGYPEVSIFAPIADSIPGKSAAPRSGWTLSLRRHPRLAGTAILDTSNMLVGLTLGDRDSVMTQIPAVSLDQVRTFLASDAPKTVCSNPDPAGVLQLTASREVQ